MTSAPRSLPSQDSVMHQAAVSDQAEHHVEQQLGRALVNNLFVLLKTAYIHQQNNTALHRPLASIQETTTALFQHTEDDIVTLRPAANAFFLNQTLIRLDRSSFQNAEFLRVVCGEVRIGEFEFYNGCDEETFRGLMQAIIGAVRSGPDNGSKLKRDFKTIYLKPPARLSVGTSLLHQRQFILHSYAQALAFTSQMLARWSQRKKPPMSHIKRTVQNLLEIIEQDVTTLLGLTQLRAYRQHLATHLVNVAIFVLVIGQRAGLSRPELVQLGITALLHELGAMDLPNACLERVDSLSEKDKEALHSLPLYSVRRLLELPVVGVEGMARAVAVFENRAHLPSTYTYHGRLAVDVRTQILAVADAYDHLTTSRLGKAALRPDQALDVLRHNPDGKFTDWAVKLLITAIGRYPIGTLVELDTGEKGIVVDLPENDAPASRPRVRLISTPDGTPVRDAIVIDLRETTPAGDPMHSIRRTLDPDVVPVNVPHFFLN